MESTQPQTSSAEAPGSARLNWFLTFVLLIAPSALALIGALTKVDAIATGSPLAGGLTSGMIFGIMMARRFGKTTLLKLLLGISCALVFGCVTLVIGVVGCSLGGGVKID